MWWRCGERYFASLLKNNSTIHVQDIFRKVWWKIFRKSVESLVIKIFRPFIRQIYFARDLRKIFRKSVEKYFDHSFARYISQETYARYFASLLKNISTIHTQETYARFGEDVVKMLWRCGDKDISTIHTPDIFRKISEDVVKVWWKFVEGFMFLNSLFAHTVLYHCSLLLLCFEYFSLKLFLWYHCSIKSCLGH